MPSMIRRLGSFPKPRCRVASIARVMSTSSRAARPYLMPLYRDRLLLASAGAMM